VIGGSRLSPAFLISLILTAPIELPAQNAVEAGSRPIPADLLEQAEDGEALIALGRLQTALAEYATAEESLLAGIGILIDRDGEFSPTLIDPYVDLAGVFVLDERPLEAITTLEHAQHISQRNFGLLNVEQVELLDEMSRAYVQAGDTAEAQNLQQERLRLALRRFGETDPRVIPFHHHLADYYDRSRMHAHAREQHEAVLAIQEDRFGEDDGQLLTPLSELLRIDLLLGRSTSARRRLLNVLESAGEAMPVAAARALAVLGDWDMVRGRTEAALAYYRRAYLALQAEDPARAAEYFSAPRFIDFAPPLSAVDRRGNGPPHAWGSITARFQVSADGRAADLRVLTSTPPGLMDTLYLERLARTTFRPRFIQGDPVATPAVRFSHEFRYFVAD